MQVVLPISCYLLICYILLLSDLPECNGNVLGAGIFGAILWAVLLYVITEGLGVFHLLSRRNTTLAWLLCVAAGLVWSWMHRGRYRSLRTLNTAKPLVSFGFGQRALLSAVCLLVCAVGITAIASPPNTWDVIDYHLPRVVVWMSNRSVSFFPTLDYAQLINSPWSEYAMLNLNLLFGGDRLVNLVEFASYVGSIIVASLIAGELGADLSGQVFAAVACATVPGCILEASGAMNDLAVAFWIAAAVYCLVIFAKYANWFAYIGAAAACGLATLTKGTAYVLLPAMIAACWYLGGQKSRRRFVSGLPVFILIVATLNGPLWYRNLQLTGSPLGSGEGLLEGGQGTQLATGRISLRGATANAVRNLTLHAMFSSAIDDDIARFSSRVMAAIGSDPNDSDFVWQTPPEVPGEHFHSSPPNRHEAFAGYPLHLLLIVVGCVLSIVEWRRGSRPLLVFTLGVLGSFALLSAFVRWQIWGARYQLPLFVLGCAAVGGVIPRYCRPLCTRALAWLLIIAAIPYALSNDLRPFAFAQLSPSRWMSERWGGSIWGKTRTELYYADSHQDLEDSYTAATRAVLRSGCNDVALDDSLEHYEYPVMALLNASTGQRRVRYDGVYNSTAKYGTPDGTPPCAVICFACARVPGKWRQYREIGGRVSVFSNVAVFFREGDLANETSPITPPRSNSDLRELTAGMLRNIIALRDFRDHGEGGRESAYLNGLQKIPGGTAALDKYLYAVERPIYDGSRVWELTGLLRKNALLDTKDLEAGQLDIQPLIDGSQALRNFAGDAPRAADDLANFVAQGKQQLARQLPK